MDFLLSAISSSPSYHAKSLSISAIGAAGILFQYMLEQFLVSNYNMIQYNTIEICT